MCAKKENMYIYSFAAEYISVCGRKNPDLSNCINASVIALEPYLRNGIAELKIPPVEPLNIEKVNLLDTNELKAIASDLQIWGLLNYHLNHLNVDFDKREIKIELSLPELKLIANYDVNIKLINAPIMSKGVIELLTSTYLYYFVQHMYDSLTFNELGLSTREPGDNGHLT